MHSFSCTVNLSLFSPAVVCVYVTSWLTAVSSALPFKAYLVQEERDRLRLEYNELEERVNPDFSSL